MVDISIGDSAKGSIMLGNYRFVVCVVAMLCLGSGAWIGRGQRVHAQDDQSKGVADEAGAETNDPSSPGAGTPAAGTPAAVESISEDAAPLGSARQTLRAFVIAMERKDFATAVSALDFSAMEPEPTSFEQVQYAEQLKECMDRLALPDALQFSDEPDGPTVSFPPETADASIMIAPDENGQWRFTADTIANIASLHEVLIHQPIIGTQAPSDPKAESGTASGDTPEDSSDEESSDEESDAESDHQATPVPDQLASARRTMRTLFDALESREYEDAVSALDFSSLESPQAAMSPYVKLSYVRRLKEIVERMASINYAEISDDPSGPAFRFPPNAANRPIVIARGDAGAWRFSAETVAQIDALHEIVKNKPVLNLPEEDKPWYDRELVLGNETWRILVLFASLFISLILGNLVRSVLIWRARTLDQAGGEMRSTVLRTIASTAVGAFFLIGLTVGLSWLILEHSVSKLVSTVIHVVFTLVIGYICFRLVDVFMEVLHGYAKRSGSTLNNMLAPIISMSLRLTIIVLALLEIITAISDQPPSAVLAGLGAGGLAVGLAAQETIKNLFGSVMIFADHPFEIGDRVVVDGHDGPVESVGFRSTRIRTLEGNLVTVPNGELANRTILNVGKRPCIRRVMNIRLAYDLPPEKVSRALEIVRDLLADHEGMSDERPPRVFLDDFLDSAINLRVFYWFHPPDFWEFTRFSEEVNLQLLKRFHDEGIRFALPSQRLFVAGDPEHPIPDDLTRQ